MEIMRLDNEKQLAFVHVHVIKRRNKDTVSVVSRFLYFVIRDDPNRWKKGYSIEFTVKVRIVEMNFDL